MRTYQKTIPAAICSIALLMLGGCAGMSNQDKSTAIGAGAGAIGGSILTGGSTAGAIGGAAVGGYIGHEIKKPK
jgi:osmotically inducible lipoprotein OsmB